MGIQGKVPTKRKAASRQPLTQLLPEFLWYSFILREKNIFFPPEADRDTSETILPYVICTSVINYLILRVDFEEEYTLIILNHLFLFISLFHASILVIVHNISLHIY